MESWELVFRDGFAPELGTDVLRALADALRADDARLVQGNTTVPPPLACVADYPVEAGCVIGYCGAVACGGFGVARVGEVEEFFARTCAGADLSVGVPGACGWLLEKWDDTPRDVVRRELLPVVEGVIRERESAAA